MDEAFLAELVTTLGDPEEPEALRACLQEALATYREEVGQNPASVRDPLLFGRLLPPLLADPRLSRQTKSRACWTLFDVIPLPEGEDEAFDTAQRIPPNLPQATGYLASVGELEDYHLYHLIYALYLDPRRTAQTDASTHQTNLTAVLQGPFDERLKLLFAYLLLGAPVHAHDAVQNLFAILLNSPELSAGAKQTLCIAGLDSTFARTWFVDLATTEGLYPEEEDALAGVLREARVRPLPEALIDPAQRWLDGLSGGR